MGVETRIAHHHFSLTPALVASTSWDECIHMLRDMQECALVRLPYPECLISFRPSSFANNVNWMEQDQEEDIPDDSTVTILAYDQFQWAPDRVQPDILLPSFRLHGTAHIQHDNGMDAVVDLEKPSATLTRAVGADAQEFVGVLQNLSSYAVMVLVTALGAKNVDRVQSINRRAGRGIGNGKFRGPCDIIYISTTRLSVPAFAGIGTTPCPHLRRGHVHTFLTGEGRSTPVKKYLQPIFVNWKPGDAPLKPRKYVVSK